MSSQQPPRNTNPNLKPRVVMDPHLQAGPGPRRPPVQDIRQTKEYKAASRRWISTIVALPIFLYTSWVLYERTYGNKQPKRLSDLPPPSSEETK
ncbi:hypothetical protein ASPSYDRAFT_142288 [Aspergillus sydowii CBS 593.65]|uniref:Uncharacterized protein n=1 Tax=Aspergillus sydowii CBS 593.65 TaxID=1036612 RepID=A0A1L9TX68_9EURO|nr:uncharacterized protein ASPSYDRAFT_142288 [Aspergillus sydowii CBS 593.65]OJJ64041.1 hypothetical protein ASPSYDRAFT_142288 [Aspergillus sydowii CBS 593.65]